MRARPADARALLGERIERLRVLERPDDPAKEMVAEPREDVARIAALGAAAGEPPPSGISHIA